MWSYKLKQYVLVFNWLISQVQSKGKPASFG